MKAVINHEEHGLHYHITHHNSPFAKASICAGIVALGSVAALASDLLWLSGDVLHAGLKTYHIFVGVGLGSALLLTIVSFIYLYHSAILFIRKVERNERAQDHYNSHKHKNIKDMIKAQEDEINSWL